MVSEVTGKYMRCSCDRGVSVKEFYGYCELCWVAMPPESRAALRGDEKMVIVYTTANKDENMKKEDKETLQPQIIINQKFSFVDFVWNVFMTVSVLALLYKTGLAETAFIYVKHLVLR